MVQRYLGRLAFLLTSVIIGGCSSDPYGKWTEIRSEEHKFKISMPLSPERTNWKKPEGREVASWRSKDRPTDIFAKIGGFDISASVAPKFGDSADKATLDGVRNEILAGWKGTMVSEVDFKRNGVTIGRQIQVESKETGLEGTIVYAAKNGKAYQLEVLGQPGWDGFKFADRFFDSFEILP